MYILYSKEYCTVSNTNIYTGKELHKKKQKYVVDLDVIKWKLYIY